MDTENLMKDFRRVNKIEYPELNGYQDYQIYEYMLGCGGLFLATQMSRYMKIKKGDIILDIGCGFGSTSIFLAKNFDVTVIAVDFWNSPEVLVKRAQKEGLTNKIIPIQLDITQTIPFAEGYFDAIFCMNSIFMFGENLEFLKRLLKTLKIGGSFGIGSECFNQEPNFKKLSDVPKVYNFKNNWSVWQECFSKYHCPEWWKSLLYKTNMLDIKYCKELDDGSILLEDAALNYFNYYSKILPSGAMISQERLIDIVLYGKRNLPYTTLYVLAGERM
jgi:SAM-dependent methyltransferase